MEIKTVRTSGVAPHIPVIEELNVTDNGTYTAPTGVDGYSPVSVDVQPNLGTKSISQNGTYTASSDNLDGYSSVTVDEPLGTKAITENGTYTASDDSLVGYSSVTVDVPVSPSAVSPKAVNFYDYDGTIVQSYSAAEFAELTEMPENPMHNGLTAQGWNWSLVNAKAYVASYGKLNIGQMYTTDDGATRLHIQLADGRLSPVLGLCPDGTLTIDWGDGSPTETMTGTSTSISVYLPHTYLRRGEYTISITPSSGSTFGFEQRNNVSSLLCKSNSDNINERCVYLNTIININFGNSVTSIGAYAFSNCYSLSSVTIPNSVTSIGQNAFSSCYSLASVTIPNSVTSIELNAFNSCESLALVTIPNSVTSIGPRAFSSCYSLASVTIPNSVTSIELNAFSSCESLASVTIPNSVTDIGQNAFSSCCSLSSVTIPNSVTSIGQRAFSSCYSLASVTIPNSVTDIGQRAFDVCAGLGYLKFTNATPPTANANAFSNVPTDCIIYVPEGSLSAYTSASNYPSSSTYQYVEY